MYAYNNYKRYCISEYIYQIKACKLNIVATMGVANIYIRLCLFKLFNGNFLFW